MPTEEKENLQWIMEEGDSVNCNSRTTCSEKGYVSSHFTSSPMFFPGKETPGILEELLFPICMLGSRASSAGVIHRRYKSVNVSYGPRFFPIAQLFGCFEQMAFSSDTSAVVLAA